MSSHNNRDKEKAKGPEVVFSGGPREAAGEPADPAAVGPGAQVEEAGGAGSLAEQIQKLLGEKQELMDTLVRRQADFENYRKRVEKERHQERHRGAELIVEHILPVLDAFDRALAGPGDGDERRISQGLRIDPQAALGRAREAGT